MCVVNKQFDLPEFVFNSVYFSHLYCWVRLLVWFLWPFGCHWSVCDVVLVPYVDAVVAVTVMRVLLFVLHACMPKERRWHIRDETGA